MIVAGACAGLLVLDLGLSSAPGSGEESSSRLIGFDAGEIVRVTVLAGGKGETVERVPGTVDGWVIGRGTGGAWPARAQQVRAALRELATTRVETQGAAGFEPGGGEVVLERRDGSVVRVGLGLGPVAGKVPVRVETRDPDDIATGRWTGRGASGLASLTREGVTRAWRREALFGISASEVGSLALRAGPREVSLERGGSGWRVASPLTIGADPERVNGVLRRVLSLRAAGFVDASGDDALLGLDEPRASITLGWGDPAGYTAMVDIGAASTDGRVYAAVTRSDLGSRVVVELDAASVGSLTAAPLAYARATASTLGASRVDGLAITDGDGEEVVSMARELGSWARVSGAAVDPGLADTLVSLATSVRSVDVSGPGEVDPGDALVRMTMTSGDASHVFGVLVSGDGARVTLVRIGGDEDGFAWTSGGSGVGELVAALRALAPA